MMSKYGIIMQDPDTSKSYLLIVSGQYFIQRLPLEDNCT